MNSSWGKIIAFLFILLLSAVAVGAASAQAPSVELSFGGDPVDTLRAGLSAEYVGAQFGAPDEVVKTSAGEGERWRYGESSIFFRDGRVTAWSDNGDLGARRERLAFTTPDKPRFKYFFQMGWKNAVTPLGQVRIEQLLEQNPS